MSDIPLNKDEGVLGRADFRNLLFLMLLAFALRAGWAAFTQPVPVSDFKTYFDMANSLRDTLSLPPRAYRMPGLPAYLALLMLASRQMWWLWGGTIVLTSAAIFPLYYFILRATGRRRAALLGGLFLALEPNMVYFSAVFASEHLFGLMAVSALAIAVAPGLSRFWKILLAGAFIGIATLARGQGGFYLPVAALAFFLLDEGKLWKRLGRTAAIFAVTFAVLTPWIVRNRIVVGPGVTLSALSGVSFYLRHSPGGPFWRTNMETPLLTLSDVERNRIGFEEGIKFIKSEPLTDLKFTAYTTRALYGWGSYGLLWSTRLPRVSGRADYPGKQLPHRGLFDALGRYGWLAVLVLAASSVFFFREISFRFWTIIGAAVFMNWFGNAVIFSATARYRYVIEILFCGLAGFTLSMIAEKASARLKGN